MNFMQWLNSLDELLYEVMSWLIFFPVTLWRTITRPLSMMEYSDKELHDRDGEQFSDTLSPPLFLILALLVSHGVELAAGGGTNPIVARTSGLAGLVSDDSGLLLLRLLLFSIFPLVMATRLVHASKQPLTRRRLKAPFYAQCYAAAPFALFLGIGVLLHGLAFPNAAMVGGWLAAISVAAYLGVQALWFSRHLKQSLWRGSLNAALSFIAGLLFFIAAAFLFVR